MNCLMNGVLLLAACAGLFTLSGGCPAEALLSAPAGEGGQEVRVEECFALRRGESPRLILRSQMALSATLQAPPENSTPEHPAPCDGHLLAGHRLANGLCAPLLT